MFLHVDEVEYLDNYRLQLKFNNDALRIVDLARELYGKVFEPLKDLSFFRQVYVNAETGTIEWSNGADFAPEFLYEIGVNLDKVDLTKTPPEEMLQPV